ncbi:hypothetical protein OSB04_005423 [Centaurea solstitialis]|uniref:Uncharacterized protein n=1 Tax=Centaurea solstitialis TaxID=347529 RepID=A0AA38TFZ6_9ASTR|nr:hypothetical protein OSB04_005423 [Centaurea solstitialis]
MSPYKKDDILTLEEIMSECKTFYCGKENKDKSFDLGVSPFLIASRMAKQGSGRSRSRLWRQQVSLCQELAELKIVSV